MNCTRVRRLYRLDGVQLRMRVRRRKHIALHRGPAPIPVGPTERGRMDFVPDTVVDERPFRIWTVVDNGSRQSRGREAGFRMTGETVGQVRDPRWIMGRNSNREHWKSGPLGGASNSTSFDQTNQSKTRSARR